MKHIRPSDRKPDIGVIWLLTRFTCVGVKGPGVKGLVNW